MLWWLVLGAMVICFCATLIVYCAMVVAARHENAAHHLPPVYRLPPSAANGKPHHADVAQRGR